VIEREEHFRHLLL